MKNKLNLLFDDQKKLTVKVADNRSELEAAYALLYQVYLAEGYTEQNSSGLRVSLFNALPTTTTVVAMVEGKVVGTLTSVRDSAIGLPCDPTSDLSGIRSQYRCISEISGLAIHPDYRGNHGRILFPLIKFIHKYDDQYHGVDAFVIAVNPKHAGFWQHVVQFESVCEEVTPSKFVKGAPAVIKVQNLKTYLQRMQVAYQDIPIKSNLYSYMVRQDSELVFPERQYSQAFDTVMCPENLHYFFKQRTNLLKKLSEQEHQILRSCYLLPEYDFLFARVANIRSPLKTRKWQRFPVHAKGQLQGTSTISPILVTEISQHGIGLVSSIPIREWTVSIKVSLGTHANIRLLVEPMWHAEGNFMGCKILKAPPFWDKMIEDLSEQYRGESLSVEALRIGA